MLKKQAWVAGCGLLAVLLLFFGGKTVQKKAANPAMAPQTTAPSFDIKQFIGQAKQKLTPTQVIALAKLENSVGRGDVLRQQIDANSRMADFWKDSAHIIEPYIYYLSQAAKLDNSEKNLTFAAQLILDNLHGEQDPAKLDWESGEAIALFEQALKQNPESDDLKIGLGSCYIYGKGRSGKPEETMKGIQQVLAVVKKDSNNMKAQLVLGVGGFVSGQYEKAIDRLNKVVKFDPANLEAIEFLALCYANTGNKAEAIKWYQFMKRQANNPEYTKEIDKRIKLLQ